MPNEQYTKIITILDESGSMHATRKDTIGGYNNFIEEQRKIPGTADITLYTFSNKARSVLNNVSIHKDEALISLDQYVPKGNTALYDAVGRAITETGKILSAIPEQWRPAKVVVVIITDGEENASTDYTREQIKKMIEHQSSVYSWQFVFLGANQDAFAESAKIGISRGSTMSYIPDSHNIEQYTKSLSASVGRYRAGGQSVGFTPEEQEAALKKLNETKLS